MTTSRRIFTLACLTLPCAARAQEAPVRIEGQAFERRVKVAGAELRLNGTGVRAVAWLKGYAAGLYLAAPARTAVQVLAQPGPKRLQMRMLQEAPAAEFVKAFNKGVTRNAPEGELPQLAPRMQRFEAIVTAARTVRKGDVVDLDLDPAQGTRFSLNGKAQGETIPGADFYAALLRAFIGEHPYDRKLRAGLLAGLA